MTDTNLVFPYRHRITDTVRQSDLLVPLSPASRRLDLFEFSMITEHSKLGFLIIIIIRMAKV